MKKVCTFLLTAAVAISFAACGGAAENKPANVANTNTKPAAPAAPTADALMAMDKAAQESWSKSEPKWFEDNLSDKFMMMGDKGKRMDRAATIEMIKSGKCDIKSMDFTEPQLSKIDNDTYVVSYKGTFDGSCTMGGKTEKLPSPMRAASVYIRNGDKWQAAWHGETMIVEPKADAKKDEAKKDDAKKDDVKADVKAADVTKDVAKKEEVKKEEVKKPEAKKEEVKKEEPKKDDAKKEEPKKDEKAAAAQPDANTEALNKLHQSGWEAWRDKDAAKLTSLLASSFAFVDPSGKWFGSRDESVKQWTTEDCKDVKNVKVSDGFGWALSPTLELFTLKGTADGTCMGHKNGSLHQTAFYVKEGSDWKLAFMFETPMM